MDIVRRLKFWLKVALRPFFLPLLRRTNLPFELLEPRIEALENQFRALSAEAHVQHGIAGTHTQHSIDSLTRVWLKLENDFAMLSSKVPDAVVRVLDERLAELGLRSDVEASTLLRLAAVDDLMRSLQRTQNQMGALTTALAAIDKRCTVLEVQLSTAVSVRDGAAPFLRTEFGGLACAIETDDRHLHDEKTR